MNGGRSDFLDHFVDESDVGEGASGHNFVISSSGAVGVEVLLLDVAFLEVSSSRRILGDRTSGGNVVSGDRVAQVEQAVSALDVRNSLGLQLSALEETRVMDVSRALLPLVYLRISGLKSIPSGSALRDSIVNLLEHFGFEGSFDDLSGFGSGGPDVLEEDIIALGILSNGFSFEVDVASASKSIGND